LLSRKCSLFTIIYMKQSTYLHYIMLQPSCNYNFCYNVMIFPRQNVLYFYISTLPSICEVPNMAVFCSFMYFPGMSLRYFLIARYHFRFHVSQALNFYYNICIFQNFCGFYLDHISTSRNCSVY